MSREEALFQSLAASGASIIAFIGVVHEYAGHVIFPWAPAALGGPFGWHALGVFAILAGLCMLVGTLHLIRFPVVACALMVAAIGVFLVVLTGIVYGEFHLIALVGSLAACLTAFCHRRAEASSQDLGA